MTQEGRRGLLAVVVCAAGPAREVGCLARLARDRGWSVRVIATPAALAFLDVSELEALTGRPVRSQYREPGQPRSPQPTAIIVAPATFNTIGKWACGIADNYALGVLAEATGQGTPIVALPFVNTALAARAPFRRSVEQLRGEGVRILLGPGGFQPHPPRTGEAAFTAFPWEAALTAAEAG